MSEEQTNLAALVRRIAKHIKYRALDHLIGQQVLINSAEGVPEDVIRVCAQHLPEGFSFQGPDAKNREGCMAKYGLLDLRFLVPSLMLENGYEEGIPLLKKLGFVADPKQLRKLQDETGDKGVDDPKCLEFVLKFLEEDLAKHQTMLRLFLRSEPPYSLENIEQSLDGIPTGYLPRNFVVEDACITNAGSVWFHKHFYM